MTGAPSRGVIGLVVQNEYPHVTEVRPRKLGKALREHGYEVVYLAENASGAPATEELAPGVSLWRFPAPRWGRLSKLLAKGHPWNAAWAWFIWRVARTRRLDLLIGGNIGLGIQTGLVGRLLGIPVVLDLFENNPAAVEARGKQRALHHLTRSRWIVELVEGACVRLSDRVWVVAHENAERLVHRGVPRGRIGLVGNTPDLGEVDLPATEPGDPNARTRFRLVYVGVLHAFRGLDLIVDAVRLLSEHACDVELVIAGDGPDRARLGRRVARSGLSDNVVFLGWVPPERVAALVRDCDVGIISNRVCEHTNTTLPNKIFDYMACGVPIASTPMAPVAHILREEACGVVLPEGDAPAAADILLGLLKDPEARRRMGSNGRFAVEHRYNWCHDARVALRDVRRLLGRSGRRGEPTVRPVANRLRGGAG